MKAAFLEEVRAKARCWRIQADHLSWWWVKRPLSSWSRAVMVFYFWSAFGIVELWGTTCFWRLIFLINSKRILQWWMICVCGALRRQVDFYHVMDRPKNWRWGGGCPLEEHLKMSRKDLCCKVMLSVTHVSVSNNGHWAWALKWALGSRHPKGLRFSYMRVCRKGR